MFKKMKCFGIMGMMLLSLSACGAASSEADSGFECGTYEYDFNYDCNFSDADFKIKFEDDGTYTYYEGDFSSYYATGTYAIDGEYIELTDDPDEGFQLKNVYRIKDDQIEYVSSRSSNYIYIDVQDGQTFSLIKE